MAVLTTRRSSTVERLGRTFSWMRGKRRLMRPAALAEEATQERRTHLAPTVLATPVEAASRSGRQVSRAARLDMPATRSSKHSTNAARDARQAGLAIHVHSKRNSIGTKVRCWTHATCETENLFFLRASQKQAFIFLLVHRPFVKQVTFFCVRPRPESENGRGLDIN